MLDVANVRAGDVFCTPACGSGWMVIVAAWTVRARGVGVGGDPGPARIREAQASAQRARVEGMVAL
jgi:hypothetical protein